MENKNFHREWEADMTHIRGEGNRWIENLSCTVLRMRDRVVSIEARATSRGEKSLRVELVPQNDSQERVPYDCPSSLQEELQMWVERTRERGEAVCQRVSTTYNFFHPGEPWRATDTFEDGAIHWERRLDPFIMNLEIYPIGEGLYGCNCSLFFFLDWDRAGARGSRLAHVKRVDITSPHQIKEVFRECFNRGRGKECSRM